MDFKKKKEHSKSILIIHRLSLIKHSFFDICMKILKTFSLELGDPLRTQIERKVKSDCKVYS